MFMKNFSFPKIKISHFWSSRKFVFSCIVALCILVGFGIGTIFVSGYYNQVKEYFAKFKIELPNFSISQIIQKETIIEKEYIPQTTQEEAVIKVVKDYSSSVVSIIISKDLPVYEQIYTNPFEDFFGSNSPFGFTIPQLKQKGTQKQEVGGGSGFIISADGLILTNKHVVMDKTAEYTVLTSDGKRYVAKVLALDPNQDIAVIKVDQITGLKPVTLGDSSNLQIGQTVIAIGNSLGEFRNTVSVGVISGLGRTITASGGGLVETLEDVIQTDAAVNEGNSGGPLLNLRGEVIGINTATVQNAQSIGFSIPINLAKKDIDQVKSTGKISYPYLGVYYTLINSALKEKYNLPVDYGAWVGMNSNGQESGTAVMPDSPAEKVGVKRGDIILEIGGEKITTDNSLAKIIAKYQPNDKTTLKILSNGQEKLISITIGERNE